MQSSDDLAYLMQHVATMLARQDDQVLQEQLGIGISQLKILNVLRYRPHMQQKAIAHALGQSEPSVSRQIKLMYKQGLLTIRVRPENRREHSTQLTPRGERFTEEAAKILERYHAPIFDRLSAKDRERLVNKMEQLHRLVCQINDAAAQHPL